MNNFTIPSPQFEIGSSQTQPNQSHQTVDLIVDSNHIQLVIEFLVSHSLPFQINFQPLPKQTYPVQIKEEKNGLIPSPIQSKQSDTIIAIYEKYIAKISNQMPPSEKDIAHEFGWSLITFKNLFKAKYSKSFYQLYMEKRMEYAALLLKKGYRANKVAIEIGYGDKSAIKFNKMFQKYFGVTPKKYQLQNVSKG